jgi:hypothetical protein
VSKPSAPNRPRHSNLACGLDRRDPSRDQPPEVTLHSPRRLRTARRAHRWPHCPIRGPLPPRAGRRLRHLLPR